MMTRRGTILSLILAMLSLPTFAGDGRTLKNAGIGQLHAALASGRLTSEQLVRYYLDRIARFDKAGPHINALISLNPAALEEARRLDAEDRGSPRRRGLLYGIPFVVKDNYDTAGIPTSGGSAALEESIPSSNAFVVQRLLDQGAVLIGKANMSELAASYGRLGYSSAGGLTVNPYNTARDVSGSSSGSAAAVAADFAAFALGTDTSGSLRGPANVVGLVGVRPTLGLTSRSGVIPLSLTFDTTGVITRSVKDAAIVLDVISGPDPRDAATLEQPADYGYAARLGSTSLKGVRLGVIMNFRGGNSDVDGIEKTALDNLEAQGAILVPITLPKEFESLWDRVLDPVGEAEFKPQLERYLQTLAPTQPKTLAQLIDQSASPPVANSLTPVNPKRLEGLRQADRTLLTDSPTYIRILTRIIPKLRQQLRALVADNRLQAFVFSTMSCPASPRFDRADPSYRCSSDDPYKAAYVASAAGFPEITVPVGVDSANIPVGYSFMGLPHTEGQLFRLADALQNGLPRIPPPPLSR
jgi:amidase